VTDAAEVFERVREWHASLGLTDLMVGDDEATATGAGGTEYRIEADGDSLVLSASLEDLGGIQAAAELAEAVQLSRPGLTEVALAEGAANVRVRVYLDGLSKQAFAAAVDELTKSLRQLRDAFEDARERARLLEELEELEDRREDDEQPVPPAPPADADVPAAPAASAAPAAPAAPPAPAAPAAPPAPAPTPAAPAPPAPAPPAPWAATHVVPAGGARFWTNPDGAAPPAGVLHPGTPLQLLEARGAWALVAGSNGWRGWVDARALPAVR
jgi:hypothetical protein